MVKNLKRLRKQIEREHGKTAATKYLLLKFFAQFKLSVFILDRRDESASKMLSEVRFYH